MKFLKILTLVLTCSLLTQIANIHGFVDRSKTYQLIGLVSSSVGFYGVYQAWKKYSNFAYPDANGAHQDANTEAQAAKMGHLDAHKHWCENKKSELLGSVIFLGGVVSLSTIYGVKEYFFGK